MEVSQLLQTLEKVVKSLEQAEKKNTEPTYPDGMVLDNGKDRQVIHPGQLDLNTIIHKALPQATRSAIYGIVNEYLTRTQQENGYKLKKEK